MLEPHRLPDIDRWLDELDKLVERGTSSAKFYGSALGQLRILLAAEGTAVVLPPDDAPQVFAFDGLVDHRRLVGIFDVINEPDAAHNERAWIAVPVRRSDPRKGLLVAFFDHDLPKAAVTAALELMNGVAEIMALHQRTVVERFLDVTWKDFQNLLSRLRQTESLEEAAHHCVNGLYSLLGASRVSFIRRNPHDRRSAKVLAVSNVDRLDPQSPVVRSLVTSLFGDEKSNLQEPNDEPKLSPHRCFLALESSVKRSIAPKSSTKIKQSPRPYFGDGLIIEWPDANDAAEAMQLLDQFSTTLAEAWAQQIRWLSLPHWTRRFAKSTNRSVSSKRMGQRLLAAVLVAGAIGSLFIPIPFRLRANGTLQPAGLRSVFVTSDGYIEEVLIGDGEKLKAGQPLIRVRSPSLDREFERVAGEQAALLEKRNGINVSLNQAAENPISDDVTLQSRLTTEMRVLDVEEQGLERQAALLKSERDRLTVRSPIEGVVVANDLRKYLDRRPVKRGDLLFRVAHFEGPWQLEMQIADRDSSWIRGHVLQGESRNFEYTTLADPKLHHSAELLSIAPSAYRDPDSGVVFDAVALAQEPDWDDRHMGAKIEAVFSCGKQPVWFVWMRPLVEAIQRRFWW